MLLIDESYNANPRIDARRTRTPRPAKPARAGGASRFVGDMLELGDFGAGPSWRSVQRGRDEAQVDVLYRQRAYHGEIYGPGLRHRAGPTPKLPKVFADALLSSLRPGDVVMIKGSPAAAWVSWPRPSGRVLCRSTRTPDPCCSIFSTSTDRLSFTALNVFRY